LSVEPTVRGDVRGRRIAVVPDSVVNPPPRAPDLLTRLVAESWGVVALWPPELDATARSAWIDMTVEQVVTFLDDDYEVVIVRAEDEDMQAFVAALRGAGRDVTGVFELSEG
jgi:hypothetical protein